MQNHTHQCPPTPQPQPCGQTLTEHLQTLPALQQLAATHSMLHDWLNQMVHNAPISGGQATVVRWYASRSQGYLLGLAAGGKGVSGAMVDLGAFAKRLAPETAP